MPRPSLPTDLDALPLEMVALSDLHPHPRNYQEHPPEELAHIRHSLQENGFYRNIVIAEDGTILAGHGVVQAAQHEGYAHIPVRRLPVGPEHPRALRVLVGDNEMARLAVRDEPTLADMLATIAVDGPAALLGTGYDADAMDALLASTRQAMPGSELADPEPEIDRAEELREQYQVARGQLWHCGQHRLLCGDCQDTALVQRLLGDGPPDLVFADPPYGVSIVATNEPVGGGKAYDIPFGGVKHRRRGYVGGGQRTKDLTGHYPIESWGKGARGSDGAAKPFGSKAQQPVRGTDSASHIVAVGTYAPVIGDESPATAIAVSTALLAAYPEAVHVWWGGNYYADHLPASSCWLVWDKDTTGNFADCELAWTNQPKAARLFHHRWNGMLRDSEHGRRWHPTQKPAALAAWVFETVGTTGDTIFDPFLGSGPTLIAAEQSQRRLFGMELSEAYIAVCLERYHQLTGDTPILAP